MENSINFFIYLSYNNINNIKTFFEPNIFMNLIKIVACRYHTSQNIFLAK